jgi:DNA-binding XRE family transcriptional regulator
LLAEVKTMKSGPTYSGSLLGFKARKARISLGLSRQEMAKMAGVPLEKVDAFEYNLPVPLDVRRRILRELWAKKSKEVIMAESLPCLKSSGHVRAPALCLPLQ